MSKVTAQVDPDDPDDPPAASGNTTPPLPWWANALDATTCALVVVAFHVAIEGGTVVWILENRVSLTTPSRVLAWAAGVFLLRHLLVRRNPLHLRVGRTVWNAARAHGPLPEDAPAFETRAVSRSRRAAQVAAVLALFTALTAVMTHPQARLIAHPVVPDLGDPLLSTWRLSWFAHQVIRDPLHLFDGNIFYPERFTLAYSDAMLVPSLTVAPLVWLGVHQIVAYNILFLSGFVFSGAAMFLLVRSLTGHTPAALIAGFVFGFLPYRYMHYSHLELQMAQWMPLCLWALHRTARTGRMRDGLLTGVFFALQTLSSLYYGIFFATYLAVVGGLILVGAGRERFRASIRPLAAGAVLASVLTAPFIAPYFAARESVGERRTDEIEAYSATPQNYLAAPYWNEMFGRETHTLGTAERELFQGFVVPLVAAVGLWPPLSVVRIAYGIGLVGAFELSLGFNGYSYGWLHEHALPYRGLRVPSRISIVVGLSLAILAGFGAARIARLARHRTLAGVALAALAVGIFFEYRTTVKLREVWDYPPPVYEAVKSDPPSVLLELPMVYPDTVIEPVYMYFSTFHWQKLVNGYSGFRPPSANAAFEWMETFPDDRTMDAVRARGVDFIIVHGAFYRNLSDYERMVAALDVRPELSLISRTKWRERETRVYRVDENWASSGPSAVSGTAGRTPRR